MATHDQVAEFAAKQGLANLLDGTLRAQVVYIATMGEAAKKKGFELIDGLRRDSWDKKISFDMDYENKSLKAQMREADKLGAKFVLIIGDDEIAKGEVMMRDMATKEQLGVKFDDLTKTLKGKIK